MAGGRAAAVLVLVACVLIAHVAVVAARKDLYKVLGIDRSASEDDIKRAYKREARKWHPDKNPNNAEEAQERFIDVTNAYETLSDPRKRRQYEYDGSTAHEGGAPGGGGRGRGGGGGGRTTFHFRSGGGFDGFDFFDEMFGRPRARRRAPDMRHSASDTLTDASFDEWIAALGEGEIALVEGYGVRCHACASIYPAWEEAARKTSGLYGVRMGRFDAHANRRLTRFFGLTEIPAIMAVDRHKRWHSLYGQVTASVLQQFASKHMRVSIPVVGTLTEWGEVARMAPNKMVLLLFTNHNEPSLHYKSLALAHRTNAVFAMAERSSRRSSALWQHFGVRSVPQLLLFPHGGVVARADVDEVVEVTDPDRLRGAQVSYSHMSDVLDLYAAQYALPELTHDTADLCTGNVVCVVLCTDSQSDGEVRWLRSLDTMRRAKQDPRANSFHVGRQSMPLLFVTLDVYREAPLAAALGVDVGAHRRVVAYVPSLRLTRVLPADWDTHGKGGVLDVLEHMFKERDAWTEHDAMPSFVDPLLWDKSWLQRVSMWFGEAVEAYAPESPQVIGQWAVLLMVLFASLRYLWENFEEVLLDNEAPRSEESAGDDSNAATTEAVGGEGSEGKVAVEETERVDKVPKEKEEKQGVKRAEKEEEVGALQSMASGCMTALKAIVVVVFVINAYVLLFQVLP